MILVFGGMYQGKEEFARKLIKEREGADEIIVPVPDIAAELEWVMAHGGDPDEYIDRRIPQIRNGVVIMSDYSQGLVPMAPEQRAFREACGRTMIRLAAESEEVYRVFCGIGTRLK